MKSRILEPMRYLRFVLALVWSGTLLVGFFSSAQAAPATAVLGIKSSTTTIPTGEELTISYYLTSVTEGISAVALKVTVPTGTTLVRTSVVDSIMPTEVIPATISGTTLTWERLRNTTGYTGTDGFIGSTTLTLSQTGQATFAIDQATSQVIAYSDSTNVLATVASVVVDVTEGTGTLPQTGSQPIIAIVGLLATGSVLASSLWWNRRYAF